MINVFRAIFPFYRLKLSNRAMKLLIISDTIFFSGMSLVEVVFGVFIVDSIEGANVINLGLGSALFMVGILLTEPIFSKFYDSANNEKATFYGMLIGNLLKSVFRVSFIFINSVWSFYLVYFLLGVVHSIEYPSFAKIFTKYLDKGFESEEWGFKDVFVSIGKILTFALSGFIAYYLGYKVLFLLSAAIMFLSGVVLLYVFRKDFGME